MASSGIGYDISSSIYSPEGRIFQIEYATQAANKDGTAIGMRIKNGVLLGSITRRASRLLKPGSNKRISHVEPHIGIVTTGWAADAREIVNIARREAVNYRESYKIPPPVNQMTRMLSFYVHAHTLYSSVRPFGVNALVAGKDDNGYQLYLMEPSGEFWGYRGCVVGKGQKEVKTQLERIDLDNLDPHIGIQKIVRMLLKAHKDSEKEEPYNIELSWICDETNGIHEKVPEEIVQQAIERFENDGEEGEQSTMEVEE